MDRCSIGNYIREKRIEIGLTQEQLAEMVGVSRNTVSRWERGVNIPDYKILRDLASVLGTDVTSILSGENTSAARSCDASEKDLFFDYSVIRRIDSLKVSGRKLTVILMVMLLISIDLIYGIVKSKLYWDVNGHSFKAFGVVWSLVFGIEPVPGTEGTQLSKMIYVLCIVLALAVILGICIFVIVTGKNDLDEWRKIRKMEKRFTYQKYDLKSLVGVLIGMSMLGVVLLCVTMIKDPNQYVLMGCVLVSGVTLIAFPKVIWPKISSKMACFYGVGSYVIEKEHLEIIMGRKTYSFYDIDEVYMSGAPEGGGAMLGGVTSYDGSLDIKEGKRKLKIITSSMWNENPEAEDTVGELYNDIKENFNKLAPVYMDNGTEIRGYLKKG
ncbi:MAG: helix-turn-helix transcriptional regulator [Firmicutes bacterium]|nr:helix-turn-helix transcriptional regulator [Bacillota bacterium]